MTTGKTIALKRQTFVGKVISLLFNMLSRLVITFLPRSKHLLTSCLQSSSAARTVKDACSLEEKLYQPRQHIEKQRYYFADKGPSHQSYGFSSSHVWI